MQPNLAWAPTNYDPASPPTKGMVAAVPPLGRLIDIKQIVMPRKGEGVFVSPSANIIGDVKLGSRSSVWYGAVLRGEESPRPSIGQEAPGMLGNAVPD